MRFATIAVCLLLVSASPVMACFEHSPEQTGWFHETPSWSWEAAWSHVEGTEWDGQLGPWLLGTGSAAVALVGVSFRAFTRAASRMPMLGP